MLDIKFYCMFLRRTPTQIPSFEVITTSRVSFKSLIHSSLYASNSFARAIFMVIIAYLLAKIFKLIVNFLVENSMYTYQCNFLVHCWMAKKGSLSCSFQEQIVRVWILLVQDNILDHDVRNIQEVSQVDLYEMLNFLRQIIL